MKFTSFQKILVHGYHILKERDKCIEWQLDAVNPLCIADFRHAEIHVETNGYDNYFTVICNLFNLIDISVVWSKPFSHDHWGLNVNITAIFLQFDFTFYDGRHAEDEDMSVEEMIEKDQNYLKQTFPNDHYINPGSVFPVNEDISKLYKQDKNAFQINVLQWLKTDWDRLTKILMSNDHKDIEVAQKEFLEYCNKISSPSFRIIANRCGVRT